MVLGFIASFLRVAGVKRGHALEGPPLSSPGRKPATATLIAATYYFDRE
jgi:hypothetical protein